MTAVGIFEEFRFIIELIIAEKIFVHYIAKKKDRFRLKTSLGWGVFLLMAVFWAWVRADVFTSETDIWVTAINICWYVFQSLLTLVHMRSLYILNISDTLFLGIAAYALQHIEYVLINETLALGIWPSITEHILLYLYLIHI